jgi:hypothetical protein
MMRRVFLLVGFLMLAVLGACAGLEERPDNPDHPPRTKSISMGLITDAPIGAVEGSVGGGVGWELTVDPTEIVTGKKFFAELKGKAIFDERTLSIGQGLIKGGAKEIMFADFRATVHVRSGAAGEDEELTPEVPYVCALSRTACERSNDLPGAPGIRGNTDCEPQGDNNPCGQFVDIPTSEDCEPEGLCDELGHTGEGSQCEVNEFCVSGPLELPLSGGPGQYEPDASASVVLFGYDDGEDTGFRIHEEGGCNAGIWYSDKPQFTNPVGSNGVRMMIVGIDGSVRVAIEYVMGEDSRSDEGIDSCDPHSNRSPDSSLIKFPIRAPSGT